MRLPRRLLGVQQLVNKWFLRYETPYHDREALKLPRTVVKITREKAWREIALKFICYSHFVLVTLLSLFYFRYIVMIRLFRRSLLNYFEPVNNFEGRRCLSSENNFSCPGVYRPGLKSV